MQKEPKLGKKGPELQEKQAQLMIDRIHEAGGICNSGASGMVDEPGERGASVKRSGRLREFIIRRRACRGTVDPIRASSWMNWQRRDMCCPAWQQTTRISTQATKQNLT